MDRYAVVGNPIAHSKSPEIHRIFAEQTEQALIYEKMLVELTAFDEDVSAFFALGGKGLNVTVPFKENAFRFADDLTPRARAAGAVNTLALQSDGRILGDNTDGAGLMADFRNQGWLLAGKNILILGAGGAVKGILAPLLEQSPARIFIANRTADKAIAIVDSLDVEQAGSSQIAGGGYAEVSRYFGKGQVDLIINGTSASIGGDVPEVSPDLLNADTAVYDLMYTKGPTAFLQWAQSQGVTRCCDGLGMLVEQAAEAFYVWRGVRPQTLPVITSMRTALNAP